MVQDLPANTTAELIERFGRIVAETYLQAQLELIRSLGDSDVPGHEQFRAYLAPLSQQEREMKIAQSALEDFIHNFMASLDDSVDFKIVGILKDGTQFDLRDLCPEGLHGNQLDWIEYYANKKTVYGEIFEREFADKT